MEPGYYWVIQTRWNIRGDKQPEIARYALDACFDGERDQPGWLMCGNDIPYTENAVEVLSGRLPMCGENE